MFALVEWTLEHLYSVINLTSVVSPRKELAAYKPGDNVSAKFQGKKYPAKIVKTSESKKELEKVLHCGAVGENLDTTKTICDEDAGNASVMNSKITDNTHTDKVNQIWATKIDQICSRPPRAPVLKDLPPNSLSPSPVLVDLEETCTQPEPMSDTNADGESEDENLQPVVRLRSCQSCKRLKKELETVIAENEALKCAAEESQNQKPKAGIVNAELAKKYEMIEVYPQTGVYWYRGQRDAVFFNSSTPEMLISRTVEVLFSKEVISHSSARGGGKFLPLDQTVIDACLRFVQKNYEVKESRLIKIINDKCSHMRRPRRTGQYVKEKYQERKQKKQEERKKRRERRHMERHVGLRN